MARFSFSSILKSFIDLDIASHFRSSHSKFAIHIRFYQLTTTMIYNQVRSPSRNGSDGMQRVNLNRSRFEQARFASSQGANASGSSSFPPTALETLHTAIRTSAASSATNSNSSLSSSQRPSTQWNHEAVWRRCATVPPPASGANWYRVIDGRVSPATALNVFLPGNQSLSDYQRKTIWKIAANWVCLDPNNRSKSEDVVANELASLWDQGHFLAIGAREHSAGYGGRMRPEHVKKILQAAGRDILESQFQLSQLQARQQTLQRSMPPSRYAQPVNPSVFASICPAPTPLPAPPRFAQQMDPSSRSAARAPNLPPLPPQPTAKPPTPKRVKVERRIRVVKGMSTASIEALNHEDIRQALLKLNRSSSNKRKRTLEVRLAKALTEQSDGFEMTFTRPCFI
jgi:hypothetical protein